MEFNSTIAALATPPGEGAIAVIRISGIQAFNIADRLFKGKKRVHEYKSHTIHYGKLLSIEGEIIDDVLLTLFKKPHSYTGEDSVEISLHGGLAIIRNAMKNLYSAGAEPAEPGEFTKRAFLNGRLDLTQAEAVCDLIGARTDAAMRGARNQMDGVLSSRIAHLRDKILDISSLIELELDFSEEDIELMPYERLVSEIKLLIIEITNLMNSYNYGKVIRDGVNVAIIGKPNVGKSSLLNLLLKEQRAIVSDIPGTTRDVISEEVYIDGILYKFHDTAGIRLTEDVVEKEGVNRAMQIVNDSDIVLVMSDAVSGIDSELHSAILKIKKEKSVISVVNKCDIKELSEPNSISISVKMHSGIDTLKENLAASAGANNAYSERTAVVTNLRHYEALSKAVKYLNGAIGTIENAMTGEFISIDLRNAENSLSEIIGKLTSDDILNNIFSKFCIGK